MWTLRESMNSAVRETKKANQTGLTITATQPSKANYITFTIELD